MNDNCWKYYLLGFYYLFDGIIYGVECLLPAGRVVSLKVLPKDGLQLLRVYQLLVCSLLQQGLGDVVREEGVQNAAFLVRGESILGNN